MRSSPGALKTFVAPGRTNEVTVKGRHFLQEDSPHEIGLAIAEVLKLVRNSTAAVNGHWERKVALVTRALMASEKRLPADWPRKLTAGYPGRIVRIFYVLHVSGVGSNGQLVLVLQLPQNQKRTVGPDSPIVSKMRAGENRKFLHFSNLHREQVVDITGELRALIHLGTTAHPPFKGSHLGTTGIDESDLNERLDC